MSWKGSQGNYKVQRNSHSSLPPINSNALDWSTCASCFLQLIYDSIFSLISLVTVWKVLSAAGSQCWIWGSEDVFNTTTHTVWAFGISHMLNVLIRKECLITARAWRSLCFHLFPSEFSVSQKRHHQQSILDLAKQIPSSLSDFMCDYISHKASLHSNWCWKLPFNKQTITSPKAT